MRAALQAHGAIPKDMAIRDTLAATNTARSNAVSTEVGKFFEEMVRDMIEESSSNEWKILRGDWREQCTEIDFVAISRAKSTAIWGSLKLSANLQDPFNQLCHVVSYFNNRLWQNDEYFSYRHVLFFISVQEDNKHRFDALPVEFNALLEKGRSKDLEDLCKRKLSNIQGGGNPFKWYEGRKHEDQDISSDKNKNKKMKNNTSTTPTTTSEPLATSVNVPLSGPIIASLPLTTPRSHRQPDPIKQDAFFRIYACHATDLDDLINGVQLDNFVPKDL